MTTPLLQIDGLSAGYGEAPILHNIDLTLVAGQSLALLGKNGMGKTTLIRTLMGLTTQHAGTIQYRATPLNPLASWQRARLGIAWSPQERAIFGPLTVEENLTIVQRPGAWDLVSIYRLMPRLAERKHHTGTQLSGGEQQMLAIARALICNPSLLLLDEPLEGLAPIIANEILQVLQSLVDTSRTSVIIVEQLARQILPMVSEAVILERGKVVYHDSASRLLKDTNSQERWLGLNRKLRPQALPS